MITAPHTTTPRLPFRALPEGATLGLWTPSSPAPALFPRRYARGLAALRAAGYRVLEGSTTRGDDGIGAASPRELADDLHALLLDERVDAVLCTTGGHTALLVLPHIDWTVVRAARKPLIGYSDATALLWGTLAQAGVTSLHGPMAVSEWGEYGGAPNYTAEHFAAVATASPGRAGLVPVPPSAWTDEQLWWDAEDDRPRRTRPAGAWRCLNPGSTRGWLLPGCANTASLLIGTPYLPDPEGAILCLDFFECGPDKVWALLGQWEAAGLLDRVAGLVIARHARPRASSAGSEDFDGVVRRIVADRPLPVLADVDFGHTEPRLTLQVGGRARLDADAGSLSLCASPPDVP